MRPISLCVIAVLLAAPLATRSQSGPAAPSATPAADDATANNSAQARAALDAMVKALGGDAWLNLKNRVREGHAASFYQGKPEVGTVLFWDFHAWPDLDRTEFTKHRDVVQMIVGRKGWEVTFKGKAALPQDIVDEALRRRDHSIEVAVKVWLKDPRTILIYEGQHLAARHMAEQVTLISANNEAVTILMDVQSHLPLRRTFEWRDPVYKDKNVDAEEYDDYHTVDGLPTPLRITRFKNDDMVRQQFLDKVSYNQPLPDDTFDADAAARHIKK